MDETTLILAIIVVAFFFVAAPERNLNRDKQVNTRSDTK